jgi:D-sedoheptulose 7-phosphate isomerase
MPTAPNASAVFEQAIAEHLAVIENLHAQRPILERIAAEMTRTLFAGNKILWCGNGGSAADAQHLAAEFVNRFRRYDKVFSRQVEALSVEGDLLVGISTSGNSRNVYLALETARETGVFTVAFTGQGGGDMAAMADLGLCIPSKDTARIQEGHILCGHMLCDWVELCVCESRTSGREKATR